MFRNHARGVALLGVTIFMSLLFWGAQLVLPASLFTLRVLNVLAALVCTSGLLVYAKVESRRRQLVQREERLRQKLLHPHLVEENLGRVGRESPRFLARLLHVPDQGG